MPRILRHLSDSRVLSLIGVASISAIFLLGADSLGIALRWAAYASGSVLLIWLLTLLWRRHKAQQAADALNGMLDQATTAEQCARRDASNADNEALRRRMHEAVTTIRTSRLGRVSGRTALYELPWYITIGNPAAGKSSAIINSGLKFPFEDGAGSVVKGVGGTRNCDWFFTTEGILLDTAGRYSIHAEDRSEWLFFLSQLKKHRPLAPINGIIVTANLAELTASPPEFAISLARNLRQRVQELTEHLGVFAPAYVMFTKTDLVAGFNEFFEDIDWNERDRAWGATLPCATGTRTDATALFDRHFEELYEGLRELGVAHMSRAQGDARLRPGLLAFPLEFAALKPTLRTFIATLFEDNPFQFEPIFRGFYFTSAMQCGEACSTSNERIEERFALTGDGPMPARVGARNGFFLRDLFSKVIFADKHLVRQYAHQGRTRLRRTAVVGAVAVLGVMLGGWSWSHANNRALAENVRADLEHIVRLQENGDDLQSRLAALEILQDRILELERFEADRPLSVGLGLYQGEALMNKLVDEYQTGIRNVMLEPVRRHLEAFLAEVNSQGGTLGQPDRNPAATDQGARRPYAAASPARMEDAYNALKTYLMLATREHLEAGHLSDQLARMWREWLEANRGTMSRDEMIKRAGRILSFHIAHADRPDWPLIENNPALVDRTRETLREVARGTPAVERVYGEIKARASTRFAPITVAALVGPDNDRLIAGSHMVSGAFTVDAWHTYVRHAIREAATGELQNTDWVLKQATRDDLTLQGSPEQIRKALTAMYQKDYADAWRRFLQGLVVTPFDSFPAAVAAMDRLGDPQRSPIGMLLRTLDAQASWDRPMAGNAGADQAATGFVAWFRHTVLRVAPARANASTPVDHTIQEPESGPVDEVFSGIARLLLARDDGAPLGERYLQQLAGIRSRLNQLANQGDPGPGAVRLMQATMDGGESELADTLRFVDEQMLAGMPDAQRGMLRPLLLGPLQQTFAAIVRPAEHELNRIWLAQVYEPFSRRLGVKYPFSPEAGIEATPAEIAHIFGPDGAIAHYVDTSMGTLVVRRGNTLSPRTWGDLGLRLQPAFIAGFARWVGPLEGAAAVSAAQETPQTTFMLMPQPAPGTTEYTIEIDGQRLQYRNGAAQWATFVWPNPGATAGARIVATRFDGNTVEIADFAGRFGLEKLINTAERIRNADGSFVLTWHADGLPVSVGLRIISSSQAQASQDGEPRQGIGSGLPQMVAGAAEAAAPEDSRAARPAIASVAAQ